MADGPSGVHEAWVRSILSMNEVQRDGSSTSLRKETPIPGHCGDAVGTWLGFHNDVKHQFHHTAAHAQLRAVSSDGFQTQPYEKEASLARRCYGHTHLPILGHKRPPPPCFREKYLWKNVKWLLFKPSTSLRFCCLQALGQTLGNKTNACRKRRTFEILFPLVA